MNIYSKNLTVPSRWKSQALSTPFTRNKDAASDTEASTIDQYLVMGAMLVYIVTLYLPYFRIYPGIINLGTILSLTMVLLASFFQRNPLVFVGMLSFALLWTVFSYFIWYSQWSGYTSATNKIFTMFRFGIPPLALLAYSYNPSIKIKKIITIAFILVYVITCITTILGNQQYDIPSRWLATSEIDSYLTLMYYSYNIGGFGFVYSSIFIIFLLPSISESFGRNGNVIALSILVVTLVCAIYTEYSIQLGLILFGLLLMLIRRITSGNLVYSVLISFALVALVALLMPLILNAASQYLNQNGLQSTAMRVDEVRALLDSGNIGRDSGMRLEKYQSSLDAFVSSPIVGAFGESGINIGGHSEFLDLLGSLGLFGLLFVISIVAYLWFLLPQQTRSQFNPEAIITFVLLTLLNPVFSAYEIALLFFFIIPIQHVSVGTE